MDLERSAAIKRGLAAARAKGVRLGALSDGTAAANCRSHGQAVDDAHRYRDVIQAAAGQSLRAISARLFSVGCMTCKGKPLSASQVRRMIERLKEPSPSSDRIEIPQEPSRFERITHGLEVSVVNKDEAAYGYWLCELLRLSGPEGLDEVMTLLRRYFSLRGDKDSLEWVRERS
ncbi:hypothetical protein [Vulcanococcus limneticus]|uniref:hypothetical protein n=1 Tax=Vulcanococcus limneticus TaxID=2170428 RepID=UPI00398C034B